jgi:hypothetical protein
MDARETKAVAPYLLRYFTQRPCRRSSCGGASIEAEQTEEVGRIEEDLPRLREAGLAAETQAPAATDRCRDSGEPWFRAARFHHAGVTAGDVEEAGPGMPVPP